MIDFDNQTDYNFSLELLEKIAKELTPKSLELLLVENEQIQTINKEFRNIDKPTDVLSFPLEDQPYLDSLGSIIINIDFAKQKAEELTHSIDEEITLLFIHGLLHLLGFDHEVDDGQMREKEEELIQRFKLPKSLIVRS